jgi:antitoxin VapB
MQYTYFAEVTGMSISTVFINNRTQAVRIPADVRLPENVKQVTVRAIGKERIIAPLESTWDSFFINPLNVTDDFMPERVTQTQPEREALE